MLYPKGFIFFFCLLDICALGISTISTFDVDGLTNNPGWCDVMNQKSEFNEETHQKNGLSGWQLDDASEYNMGCYNAPLQKNTHTYSLSIQLQDHGLLPRSHSLKANCFANLGFIKESSITFAEGKTALGEISGPVLKHDFLAAYYWAQALIMVMNTKLNEWSNSIFSQYQRASVELSKIKRLVLRSGRVMWDYYISKYYLSNNQLDLTRHYLYKSLKHRVEQEWNEYSAIVYNSRLGYLLFKHKDRYEAIDHFLFVSSTAEGSNNEYQKKYIYLAFLNVYRDFCTIEKVNVFSQKYILCAKELLSENKRTIIRPENYLGDEQERAYKDKLYLYMLWIVGISSLLLIMISKWLVKYFSGGCNNKQQTAGILQSNIELISDQHLEKETTKIELQEILQMATLNNPSFFVKFKEFEPEFINKLLQIAPNLVASELELCAYLRLNFETKEIARYALLSVRSVQGKKHRIRKKLMISPIEDLNLWMLQL